MQTEWFKARMAHLHVTQEQIGEALALDRTVVSRIINGHQPLKLTEVRVFADLLQVDVFEVFYRADFWGAGVPPVIRAAPLLNEVDAGRFAIVAPDRRPTSAEHVLVQYPRDTIFALRVSGDSMDKIAGEGSVVVVDYARQDLSDGDLAVFRLDGEATFKRYRRSGPDAWLQPESTNPRHAPIFPNGPVEVVGLVVDIRPEHTDTRPPQNLPLGPVKKAAAPKKRKARLKKQTPRAGRRSPAKG